jgi:hypothetical protein
METYKVYLMCADLLVIGFGLGILVMSAGFTAECDELDRRIEVAQERLKRSLYNKVRNEN